MGMDCTAYLAFGIKLPKEFTFDDDSPAWEKLEEIFYPYERSKQYPLLEMITVGDCQEPEVIVACKSHIHSVDWTAEPIDIGDAMDLNFEELNQLGQFANDLDIDATAGWHLGVYVSY